MSEQTLQQDAAALADLVRAAGTRGTVAFTGAGASTESGIPDFRGPSGLWSQNAPISYQDFLSSSHWRRESWRRGLNTYAAIGSAQPNAGHRALVEWWNAGLLRGAVTQNIDGLHQKAGLPDEAEVELHGNTHWVQCLSCEARTDRISVNRRVEAGDDDPACHQCGGILKITTISFGQPMPGDQVERARAWLKAADLCLVIGTSLVVYPAAGLPALTLQAGGKVAIVNNTETDLDPLASLVSRHPAGQVLAEAARLLRQAGS